MKERLAKLINVKSIVTILMAIGFLYGFINRNITEESFLIIFTTIIAFYFGTQTKKNEGD